MLRQVALLLCVLAAVPARAEPAARPAGAGTGAQRMLVNGVPLELVRFSLPLSPDAAIERYRAAWLRERPGVAPLRHAVGDWIVLGRPLPRAYETVQIRRRADGGSDVLATTTRLDRPPRRPRPPPLALPAGSRVLQTVESEDAGRTAVQTIGRSPLGIVATERWLASFARLRGWRRDAAVPAARQPAEARVIHLARDGDEIQVVLVTSGQGSAFVVHHVTDAGSARR